MQYSTLLCGLALLLSISIGAAQEGRKVYDAEVGPWAFEAEEFVLPGGWVWDDPAASGGKAPKSDGLMTLDGLPFPRTSRPVTVYLRVWPGTQEEEIRLTTTDGGGKRQPVTSIKPEQINRWQWLQFAPVAAEEVGDSFGVEFRRPSGVAGRTACDVVAISTRPDLDEAALDQAPMLFTPGPLAVVARTASAPNLDGLGDDPCWENAVACGGFVRLGSPAVAEADTTVKMVYDDANLYLLISSDEPILNVAQQRRHEFVAEKTQRDDLVYEDDSAVILLDPTNTGRQVYDFTVNAQGTVADARCTGPDLWETRDLGWDSGAQARGNIGEDVWTVEMAIPFADLGGTPGVGDRWQACLGRLAKARQETSSWNPSAKGFHDPIQLGTLVFGDVTPGVSLTTPASLQLGGNEVTASLSPLAGQPVGVYLYSGIAQVLAASKHPWSRPSERSRTYGFVEVADKPAAVLQSFEVRDEGELSVEHAVFEAATLKPLYLTPALTRVAKSSVAQVGLACDGPYELYLNDELIGRGTEANDEAIVAPLQKGPNVFALKLEKGTAAIAVEPPGSRFTGETWKVAPADTTDATLAALDDVAWPMVKTTGDHPKLGPIVGEPGQGVVLRRTLLWEKTRIWNTPVPAYYLARGPAQHFNVLVEGVKGRSLEAWTTYVATPPDFEIVGAGGFYATTTPDQPYFRCTQLGVQEVAGQDMRVVKVTADKPVLAGRHYIMSMFNVFVRYRDEAGEPADLEHEFRYWSEANAGNVSEPPQSFKVRLLPKLSGQQPKTLLFELYGGWLGTMDEEALREEVLKCAQAAGFNEVTCGGSFARWLSDNAPRYGMRTAVGFNFEELYWVGLDAYLQEHPDERLVNLNGTPDDHYLCTTLVLGERWTVVEAQLASFIERNRPHVVTYDYEYGPLKDGGAHSCYCPRCLAAFREYAGLAPDVTLDAQVIKQQYAAQWIDFMARRVAQICAKLKEAIHRLSPGTHFSLYSGYQTPDQPERYGLDWRYVGELQACDFAVCGYGRPVEATATTIEALQGIPLAGGTIIRPYNTWETRPNVPITRAEVLLTALDCPGGVMVYNRNPMDGRSWYAVAEVSRLAATYEDLFLSGARSSLPGLDSRQVQVLGDGRTTLICAMNGGSTPVEYAIVLPADAGAGQEFYSGKLVDAGETVTCALEPGEAVVYVLRK